MVREGEEMVEHSVIGIFGCGAIGSQLALHIAREDRCLLLLDDDRISGNNVGNGTSSFSLHHVDVYKAIVLSEIVYHRARCIAEPVTKTLTERNVARWTRGLSLAVDAFDNARARNLLHNIDTPVLHVGVSEQRTGAIVWDRHWQPMPITFERGQAHICTNEIGAPILRLTSALAANVIEHFLATEEQRDLWVTEDGRTYS
jgi:hypothetical protein